MDNLQIKKAKYKKRSVESLIEDSAIDNEFNMEAHELRKAFNQTLQAMNTKNEERQRELQKAKILLRQHQEAKKSYEAKIYKLKEELTDIRKENHDLSERYRQINKKLQHLSYKYDNITENRELFDRSEEKENEVDIKKKLRSEIYEDVNRIVSKKVHSFTAQMKGIAMNKETQQTIEAFLEELLYLNPYSEFQVLDKLRNDKRNRENGKIRRDSQNKITDQQEWKMLEKSLEKLKQVSHGTTNASPAPRSPIKNTPVEKSMVYPRSMMGRRVEQLPPDGMVNRSLRDRSLTKRRKLFDN